MEYMIFDSTANLVEAFDDEREARLALEAISHQDPDAADDYALMTVDDNGHVVGAAITAAELEAHA